MGTASQQNPGLTAEECSAFKDLGLPPEAWGVLYSLPILKAAWQDEILEKTEQDEVKDRLEHLLKLQPLGSATPSESLAFLKQFLKYGDARPEEQKQLRLGLDLLAWRLARTLDYAGRQQQLQSIRALGLETLTGKEAELDAVLDELRSAADAYLTRKSFEFLPADPGLAEVSLPALHARIRKQPWQELLILPLIRLMQQQGDSPKPIQKAIASQLARRPENPESMSWDFLLVPWNEQTSALSGSSLRPEQESELQNQEAQLIAGLAKLDYAEREALLGSLQQFADEAHWGGRGFKPAQTAQVFDGLHAAIDARRLATREGIPSPPVEHIHKPAPAKFAGEPIPPGTPAPPFPTPPEGVVAEPFTTITLEQALKDAHSITPTEVAPLVHGPLLFAEDCLENGKVAFVKDAPEVLWILGDIHCDLLAMANAWNYIQEVAQREGNVPSVLFLGDFVDRGQHGHETLLYLFRLIRDNPGRIGVIAGNHDEEFHWDEANQRFRSGVDPAETTSDLNASITRENPSDDDRDRIAVGKLSETFFSWVPRAVILPDGLLVTHGGFPHKDLHERLQSRADLDKKECLQDFTWLRLGNGARKRPYRGERGCEFGYEDFGLFCKHATEKMGVTVSRMLRGHDHIAGADRYEYHKSAPILTFNTMCRRLHNERMPFPTTRPCIARYRPNQMPEIHVLPLAQEVVLGVYPVDPPAQ